MDFHSSDPEGSNFPLVDALDHEILMHRDAHFGGLFSVMLDYYRGEGKGIQEAFSIQRIERLADLEKELKENLAPLYLTGPEAEQIADAKKAYKQLREIYDVKNPKNKHPKLIADLVLSEQEEPIAEMEAILAEKEAILPALLDLVQNEQFSLSLFPGYGLAPGLAIECLGRLKDKRALIPLFEALGEGDFFGDEQILKALKKIGDPAQQFLLKILVGKPLNEDNEKAAIALIEFSENPEVASAALAFLQQKEVQQNPSLFVYTALLCTHLKDPAQRQVFKELAATPHIPKIAQNDMKAVIRGWIPNAL